MYKLPFNLKLTNVRRATWQAQAQALMPARVLVDFLMVVRVCTRTGMHRITIIIVFRF